jgi:predicted ATPase/DNA-binding XRE family transcriptional regulator
MLPDIPFSDLLRRLRRSADLTQEQLSELAGCAVTTLRAIESGRRRPSREMALRLAQVLRVALDDQQEFVHRARTSGSSDEPEASAPASTLPEMAAEIRPMSSLPVLSEPLIGRQEELAQLVQALTEPDGQLVTLIGPGGVGKTRIALQVAADLAPRFAHGAAFVSLAPVAEASNIATTIATTLGCPIPATQLAEEALQRFLSERHMLLVLDNAEHLLGSQQGVAISTLISGLMQAAPRLRLLVTSRERLRLRMEKVIELGGLQLPTLNATSLEQNESVLLFVERARLVSHDFRLAAENWSAVAQICRLVDGMPLGIELAAAWIPVLSPEEIAAELRRGLDTLTATVRDLPMRHRSLQAVIDYSWQLLNRNEQQLLACLSLFNGSCSRDAVAAIYTDTSVLPLLAALVDKSLLRRVPQLDKTTRYELHQLMRQYAAQRLAADTALKAAAQERFATFYANFLANQEAEIKSARQRAGLQAINTELDNVRAAWHYAVSNRRADLLWPMMRTLDWFCEIRGTNDECRELFRQGHKALEPLVALADTPDSTRALYWWLFGLEGWHMVRRDPNQGIAQVLQAVAEQRKLGESYISLNTLCSIGYVFAFAGQYETGIAAAEEARDLAITYNQPWVLSVALIVRAVIEVQRNELVAAQDFLNTALEQARAVGDPRHINLVLFNLGLVALLLGQFEEAERYSRDTLLIALENQDRFQTALALQSLGRVALARGSFEVSDWLLNDSLRIAQEIGDIGMVAQNHGHLAQLAAAAGDHSLARQQHQKAVLAAAAPLTTPLEQLALFATFVHQEQPAAALTVLLYIRDHQMSNPATRALATRLANELEAALASEERETAIARAASYAEKEPRALLGLLEE